MLTLHLESAHVSSIVTSRYRPRSALSSIRLRNSTWEQSNSRVWLSLAVYIRNETSSRIASFCHAQMHRVRTFVGRNFSRWSYVSKYEYFFSSLSLFLSILCDFLRFGFFPLFSFAL